MNVKTLLSKAQLLKTSAHQAAVDWTSDERWAEGAQNLLQEYLAGVEFDPFELLKHSMFRSGVIPTFQGLGFSDHPLTLWSTELMSLDVYYWYPGETAPHDHGFHGAFMPIWGEYAERIYQFTPQHHLGEGMELGILRPQVKVVLKNGVAQAIHHAPAFIHEVSHESFCVTLCLRSRFQGEAMSDYYSSGIKLSTHKDYLNGALEDWQRIRLLLDFRPEEVPALFKAASLPLLSRWWLKEIYPLHRQDIKQALKAEILSRPWGERVVLN